MLARSRSVIVSVVALASIGPASTAMAQAQPFPPVQLPTPRAQLQSPEPPSSPFFVVPPQPNSPPQLPPQSRFERAQETAKPKVVCGMTVIPANPKVDPKFVIPLAPMVVPPQPSTVPPQPYTAVKPTIRTVSPAICR